MFPWQPQTPLCLFPGMNAAVRAVVRMGIYVGAKVYFIHEVRRDSWLVLQTWPPGGSAVSVTLDSELN